MTLRRATAAIDGDAFLLDLAANPVKQRRLADRRQTPRRKAGWIVDRKGATQPGDPDGAQHPAQRFETARGQAADTEMGSIDSCGGHVAGQAGNDARLIVKAGKQRAQVHGHGDLEASQILSMQKQPRGPVGVTPQKSPLEIATPVCDLEKHGGTALAQRPGQRARRNEGCSQERPSTVRVCPPQDRLGPGEIPRTPHPHPQ